MEDLSSYRIISPIMKGLEILHPELFQIYDLINNVRKTQRIEIEKGTIKMLRYGIINRDTIEVDLQNDYKVIALAEWNHKEKKYYVTLLIHEQSVDNWSLIEEPEKIPIESDVKSIKKDMAVLVTNLLTEGFFKEYIERYEYELKCLDCGSELYDKERMGTKNV